MATQEDLGIGGDVPPRRGSTSGVPLSVAVVRKGSDIEVRAVGDVDYATAPLLVDALHMAVPQTAPHPAGVALHLGNVRFLDSSGIATLLEARRALEDAGSRLTVVDPSEAVVRSLELA